MLTKKRLIRAVVFVAGLGLLIAGTAYVVVSLQIGKDVRATSDAAMRQYPGDKVEALLRCVEDTSRSFRDRNRAVWALGQWGDRAALPTLRKYHSGAPCDHTAALCQQELAKAIDLLEGGMNASAGIWRRNSGADRPAR